MDRNLGFEAIGFLMSGFSGPSYVICYPDGDGCSKINCVTSIIGDGDCGLDDGARDAWNRIDDCMVIYSIRS